MHLFVKLCDIKIKALLLMLCDIKIVASTFRFQVLLNKVGTMGYRHGEGRVYSLAFWYKYYSPFVDPTKNACPFRDMH